MQIHIKKTKLLSRRKTPLKLLHSIFPPANPLCFRVVVCSLKNIIKKKSDLDAFNPRCITQIIYRYCEEWRFNLFFCSSCIYTWDFHTNQTWWVYENLQVRLYLSSSGFRTGCRFDSWSSWRCSWGQTNASHSKPPQSVWDWSISTVRCMKCCAENKVKIEVINVKFLQVLGLYILLLVVCVRLHVQN